MDLAITCSWMALLLAERSNSDGNSVRSAFDPKRTCTETAIKEGIVDVTAELRDI
jgi:hypothetical protein